MTQEKFYLSLLAPHLKRSIELNKITRQSHLNERVSGFKGNSSIIGLDKNRNIQYQSESASGLLRNGAVRFELGSGYLGSTCISGQVKEFLTTSAFTQEKTFPLKEFVSEEVTYLHKVKPISSLITGLFCSQNTVDLISALIRLI